jgi:hypothetical protein
MVHLHAARLGTLAVLLAACPSSGDDEATGDTSGGSTGDTGNVTTINLPPVTSATGDTSSDTGGDSSDGGTADSTGAADSTGSDTGPGDSGSDSETGNTATYDVSWCQLQYPPDVTVQIDEAFTMYVRIFAEGLTDLTGGNDPAPELVVELGYGVDGSDPSMGDPWTWLAAGPNAGYAPGAPDYSALNDEYWGDLSIDAAGIFDYAARASGDGGTTWVYCDLDGLAVGGYTPEMAGDASVGQ